MTCDSRHDLQNCLIAAIGKVKSVPTVKINAGSDLVYDLNMDSLEMQEMIIILEEDYAIVIQENDLSGVRTIHHLVERWHQRHGILSSLAAR